MRPRTDEKQVHNAQFLSWGGASIASSPCGLIGLITPSFSGTRGLPCSPQVCPSPRSQQQATKVSRTLAPLDTNYFNVYLGVETNFWSPGTSLVTLAPRVGGGAEIPLPRPTQVSICLDILDFHSADINEGE